MQPYFGVKLNQKCSKWTLFVGSILVENGIAANDTDAMVNDELKFKQCTSPNSFMVLKGLNEHSLFTLNCRSIYYRT